MVRTAVMATIPIRVSDCAFPPPGYIGEGRHFVTQEDEAELLGVEDRIG
jgi:hypothetical protein